MGGSALPPLPPHALAAPQLPICGKITDKILMFQNYLINNFAKMRRLFGEFYYTIVIFQLFSYIGNFINKHSGSRGEANFVLKTTFLRYSG